MALVEVKLPVWLLSTNTLSGPGSDNVEILVVVVPLITGEGFGPLTLVDGVERSMSQMENPNDVNLLLVLKDASAY